MRTRTDNTHNNNNNNNNPRSFPLPDPILVNNRRRSRRSTRYGQNSTENSRHRNKASRDFMKQVKKSFRILEMKCDKEQPICDLLNIIKH